MIANETCQKLKCNNLFTCKCFKCNKNYCEDCIKRKKHRCDDVIAIEQEAAAGATASGT